MRKSFFFVIGAIWAGLFLIIACAPKSVPALTPSPSTIAPVSTSTSNIPPVRQAQGELPTSQNAAWAKVEENGLVATSVLLP